MYLHFQIVGRTLLSAATTPPPSPVKIPTKGNGFVAHNPAPPPPPSSVGFLGKTPLITRDNAKVSFIAGENQGHDLNVYTSTLRKKKE